ncbi:MAG: hypothetical protein M0P19_12975 [Nevskia sp.]|jgi:hypothetical protein|nr:hypothetical protein [Nevskia sp.]MCK9384835.1 hypothetical protein [Nevskia sp.]
MNPALKQTLEIPQLLLPKAAAQTMPQVRTTTGPQLPRPRFAWLAHWYGRAGMLSVYR